MLMVRMKGVELYGGYIDGLELRLPETDLWFIYEVNYVVNGILQMSEIIYQASGEYNSKGNEKFYFCEEIGGSFIADVNDWD